MPDETKDVQKREQAVPAEVERQSERQTVLPNVDIIETPEGSVLLADLPGCDQDSLDLSLENGVLTVTAQRQDESVPDHDATYTEYQGADFERSFSVSELIDTEQVNATVKDGVLRVTLPKAEAAKPKKIDIKTG